MTPSVVSLIASIKSAKLKSDPACSVRLSKPALSVVKLFRKHSLIYGAKAQSSDRLIVYLRYFRGQPSFSSLNAVSSSGKRAYTSFAEISRLVKQNPVLIFFLSTPFGLVSYTGGTKLPPKFGRASGELLAVAW